MLVVVAAVVLTGCTLAEGLGPEPTSTSAADVGQSSPAQIELQIGQNARVASVTITFVRVSDDSRCPRGVTCIWEGDATVELRIQPEDGAVELMSLHANPGFTQEATAARVRVRLVRLEPSPEADRPVAAGDYRVVLSAAVE
ncbi:MAG: hypothetical protein OEW19_00195 [Acidobacteriota bacterium]|nr:hypothetical protein [Acidobacteriota bacterium]